MLSVYIFCLVLGGAFLLVSLVGDAFDSDVDVDTDVDFDVDADFDVNHDFDLDHDVDLEADVGHAAAHAAHATHATKIFSIRGLIYSMFGFGAVGSLATWTGSSGFVGTLIAAIIGGLITGAVVTVLFNWIKATDIGDRGSDRGFIGLTGKVTLPIHSGSAGTVAVERGARRITLRALPHSTATGDPSAWRSVVVVEMERGVARVAPVEEDLALEP